MHCNKYFLIISMFYCFMLCPSTLVIRIRQFFNNVLLICIDIRYYITSFMDHSLITVLASIFTIRKFYIVVCYVKCL